ncbi:hypothetical protein [Aestuariivirga litoralis]|uniref:hypothetical protein n=1 Tax=Aestuariivirga litoralis TaxID=2650924 RepID=UPI0018C7B5E7|nr:hypothetical protein [Aestuariivirga litoralis]MBG1233043.1 hypothetical protein [Aestuariivirga litoralis]
MNQIDPNFQIIVAAEDQIDIPEARHPKVTIAYFATQPPKAGTELLHATSFLDHQNRRQFLTQKAKDAGGTHVMILDADDLVSRHLVHTINVLPSASGYAFTRGHVMDFQTRKIYPCPSARIGVGSFEEFCGSGHVFTLAQDPALPQPWPEAMVEQRHKLVSNLMRENAHPFLQVRERLVIYMLNSGVNMSNEGTPDSPFKKFAVYASTVPATYGHPMTRRQIREFALDQNTSPFLMPKRNGSS